MKLRNPEMLTQYPEKTIRYRLTWSVLVLVFEKLLNLFPGAPHLFVKIEGLGILKYIGHGYESDNFARASAYRHPPA